MLETRWSLGGVERYEAERSIFGDLDQLDHPATHAHVPPAKGVAGSEVLRVLEEARREDPSEPFWSGVHDLRLAGDGLEVEWHEPVEPELREEGAVAVACHLYDPRLASQG
jgi:peptide/nickel transport system ATP-binding protein